MEKWALKIGLAKEGVESDKALHWLTSAKGEDPASLLIGLTRLEEGRTLAIGAALHWSLGQGCLKSFARKRSQDPGIIGLKSCGSAEVCYTGPKMAAPSIIQSCSEPVREVRGESSRPAGQGHQAAQDLAGQLEGRKVTSSDRVSTPEVPAVTSRAETAAAVKKLEKWRAHVKIDINVKYKCSDEICKTKESHQPANSGSGAQSRDWGQSGRGTGERKVVLGGDPDTQKPPPWAARQKEQLLCGDHLWSETGLSEAGGDHLRCDRSDGSSKQDGRPESVQGQLEHGEVNSPTTRPGVNNHDGGASPPLTGQQDDQAKLPAVLAAPVFVKPRREKVSRGSSRGRRPTSTRATTMISLASWWEFHIFKTERILSMPERWAEMLPALGKNAVLHKIVKCKHDISTAAVELAKGELVWRNNSGGDKRSRSNFSTFDETAATMKAKMHFLKMLERRLERAGSAYSDEDFDTCMALGRYIADKEQDIKRIADKWSETSAEFRNRASAELARRENLPAVEGDEEDDPTGEEAEADEEDVVETAAATQNEEEMVTDADIEQILDDIEDEDEETDKEDSTVQEEEEEKNDDKGDADGRKEANVDEEKMDNNVEVADKRRKKEDSEKDEEGKKNHAEEEQEEIPPVPTPDTQAQEQVHLRPYLLSLQDGAADLPVWMRKMKTYFTLSNFSEKKPSTQQAVVMSCMDNEMGKFLQQEMEGVEANLTNLLAAIQYIFDQMYPRCMRCGETEDYQRNPHDLNNSGCLTKEMEEEKEDEEEKEEG